MISMMILKNKERMIQRKPEDQVQLVALLIREMFFQEVEMIQAIEISYVIV